MLLPPTLQRCFPDTVFSGVFLILFCVYFHFHFHQRRSCGETSNCHFLCGRSSQHKIGQQGFLLVFELKQQSFKLSNGPRYHASHNASFENGFQYEILLCHTLSRGPFTSPCLTWPHIAAMARVKSYLTLLLLFLPEGELHPCSYEIHDRSVGLKCKLYSIINFRVAFHYEMQITTLHLQVHYAYVVTVADSP